MSVKPRVFLEKYLTVHDKSNAEIENELLPLTTSLESAKSWRRWCSMWNRDVELYGNFGYAVELWNQNSSITYKEFTDRLIAGTKLHRLTCSKMARTIMGFAGVRKELKTYTEMYDWWIETKGTIEEMSVWSGQHENMCYICICIFDVNSNVGTQVWQVWKKARYTGVRSRPAMVEKMMEHWARATSYMYVKLCEVVSGVTLDVDNIHEEIADMIDTNPGRMLSDYVNMGVGRGIRAPIVHKHATNYLSVVAPGSINTWLVEDECRKLADKLPIDLQFTDWIDQLICQNVHPSVAYSIWNERYVK